MILIFATVAVSLLSRTSASPVSTSASSSSRSIQGSSKQPSLSHQSDASQHDLHLPTDRPDFKRRRQMLKPRPPHMRSIPRHLSNLTPGQKLYYRKALFGPEYTGRRPSKKPPHRYIAVPFRILERAYDYRQQDSKLSLDDSILRAMVYDHHATHLKTPTERLEIKPPESAALLLQKYVSKRVQRAEGSSRRKEVKGVLDDARKSMGLPDDAVPLPHADMPQEVKNVLYDMRNMVSKKRKADKLAGRQGVPSAQDILHDKLLATLGRKERSEREKETARKVQQITDQHIKDRNRHEDEMTRRLQQYTDRRKVWTAGEGSGQQMGEDTEQPPRKKTKFTLPDLNHSPPHSPLPE